MSAAILHVVAVAVAVVAVAASAAVACAVAAAAVVVHLVGQLQPPFPDSSLAASG